MARRNRVRILVAGFLIMTAIASAACSTQTANEVPRPESELMERKIKVYESPT